MLQHALAFRPTPDRYTLQDIVRWIVQWSAIWFVIGYLSPFLLFCLGASAIALGAATAMTPDSAATPVIQLVRLPLLCAAGAFTVLLQFAWLASLHLI
jgi:hypothetical protein